VNVRNKSERSCCAHHHTHCDLISEGGGAPDIYAGSICGCSEAGRQLIDQCPRTHRRPNREPGTRQLFRCEKCNSPRRSMQFLVGCERCWRLGAYRAIRCENALKFASDRICGITVIFPDTDIAGDSTDSSPFPHIRVELTPRSPRKPVNTGPSHEPVLAQRLQLCTCGEGTDVQ